MLGIKSVGHTGTLDPFATGLLVLLLGRATRLARFVEADRKQYLATARLGFATTTDDLTGEPLGASSPGRLDEGAGHAVDFPGPQAVEAALAGFLGAQRQRPPAFSAKHVGGERSYRKARRGERVELPEVEIVVERMALVGYQWPEVTFRATVSSGTYVRALARDLGERLGTGGHLVALRREAIGELRVDDAVPLDQVSATAVRSCLSVLPGLERLPVREGEARDLGYGKSIRVEGRAAESSSGRVAATLPEDRLIAVGRVAEGRFHPEVVLEPQGD